MPFTNNWFDNNIQLWIQKVLPNLVAKPRILEIGSYEGRSTCWIMDNISESTIDCVDTFEGGIEHAGVSGLWDRFKENTRPWDRRIKTHIGESAEIVRRFAHNTFDMVYIDGSHQAKDVLTDAIQSFYCLKHGGIMVFDDYEWTEYRGTNLHPQKAIDYFMDLFSQDIEIIFKGYQVILKKK